MWDERIWKMTDAELIAEIKALLALHIWEQDLARRRKLLRTASERGLLMPTGRGIFK